MYARLENEDLVIAPYYLVINNNKVWNASEADHIAQGWYPVLYTEPPVTEEGYHAECSWEQEANTIMQTWTIVEDEPSIEDIMGILMGDIE